MSNAAQYSKFETLRDGLRVEIRALRPDDQDAMITAVGRTSAKSLYSRFFSQKRNFSEQEVAFFVNPDFTDHVALVAIAEDRGLPATIGGGGRYIVTESGKAEVAFTVVDQFQGRGIGGALLRHLADLARAAGIRELTADVLSQNTAMLKVFTKSGLPISTKHESTIVHVTLQLC